VLVFFGGQRKSRHVDRWGTEGRLKQGEAKKKKEYIIKKEKGGSVRAPDASRMTLRKPQCIPSLRGKRSGRWAQLQSQPAVNGSSKKKKKNTEREKISEKRESLRRKGFPYHLDRDGEFCHSDELRSAGAGQTLTFIRL